MTQPQPNQRQPLIIKYTNLLHAHGVGSEEAETFKKRHKNKPLFQRRAATLDRLFKENKPT